MKTIIVLSCLLSFLLCPLVKGQYIYNVEDITEGMVPGIVFVYGATTPSYTAKDSKQLIMNRGNYKLTIDFNRYSKILHNWTSDSAEWNGKWKDLQTANSVCKEISSEVASFKGSRMSEDYKDLMLELIDGVMEKKKLDREWNDGMLEWLEGKISIYNAKDSTERTYYFSKSSGNTMKSHYFQMYAGVKDSRLVLFFIIGTDLLPEIFREIFPIFSAKI